MSCVREATVRILNSSGLPGEELERNIYNRCIARCRCSSVACSWSNIAFSECYTSTAMSVIRNSSRILAIADAGVPVSEAASKPPHEVAPDVWSLVIAAKKERDAMYSVRQRANTNMYSCKSCRSKECHYFSLQTRSGDEPMTVFVCCLNCGNRWRTEG